jgi:pimeloyl-ACP methyl ester carboxylesterase
MKNGCLFICTILLMLMSSAQNAPFGNNPQAGSYFDVGDAKIYYEVYGKGEPIVVLHGGVYGYIDEFEPFIKRFSEKYQVICIATRGHGKSEMGHSPYSYTQRAEDAYKVIRALTMDSVVVLGFSDGANSGLKLAALYPQLVKKLIAIGTGDYSRESTPRSFTYNPQDLMKYDSAFFARRLALMPEPKRWAESLSKLNKLYNEEYLSAETFVKIKCPVLMMSGDRDQYVKLESVVKAARSISNCAVSVIPACDHVVFFCNFPAVWEAIIPFLQRKN